jgi:hypothetical protein
MIEHFVKGVHFRDFANNKPLPTFKFFNIINLLYGQYYLKTRQVSKEI